jgi:site-specific DNA recombinase
MPKKERTPHTFTGRKLIINSAGQAAIYARRSDKESKKDRANKELQIEHTIKTQTEGGLVLARDRNFRVSQDSIFQEYFTGFELWDRPLLTELRSRIKAGRYKALICHSTDRLARNPIHLAIIAEECERAGCELLFVTEPLDNSPEAQLIRYIKGYAALMEGEKIKERIKRQRAEIIGSGHLVPSGFPKYGYQWDKENLCRARDEKTAPNVYNIFKWTIEGLSGRVIANKLQAARIPTPSVSHGREFKDARAVPIWNNTTISRILKDESYTGKTYANMHKTTAVRTKGGKMKTVLADKSEWIHLPDGITPPIITEEMFNQARAVVEANKKKANYTRNSKRPYLLRGMIFCIECENPMYPEAEQIRVMRNRVRNIVGHTGIYRCSHGRKKINRLNPDINCTGGRVYASDVERLVWDKVLSFFSDPNQIAAEVEKALADMPDDQLREDMESTERELRKIQRLRSKMIERWKEAVAEGDDDLAEKFDADIRLQGEDIRAFKAVIEDLEQRIAAYDDVARTANKFQEYCALVAEGMKGEFPFKEKVAALKALNVKVFTGKNRPIKIRLNTGVVLQTAPGSAP